MRYMTRTMIQMRRYFADLQLRLVGNPFQRLFFAAAVALTPVSGAYAQADPATYLKNLATYMTGTLGQSLAILGIIAIGLAWMFGRASLGLVAGVVGGIVILFGATFLAGKLTGAGG
jgi:type IV secretion system protein VirB2